MRIVSFAAAGLAALALASGAALVLAGAAFAGAPLKGCDVKLGKPPGGTVASRLTDRNGDFSFGPMAAGDYTITVVPPAGTAPGALRVVVTGTAAGTLTSVLPTPASARAVAGPAIAFRVDGSAPLAGNVSLATPTAPATAPATD